VDTRHPATARRAIDAGARWINDVGGFADPGMRDAVRDGDVDLVAMHSLTLPVDRAVTVPLDADPVELVADWAVRRLAELEAQGFDRRRIVLDPGIGFGKTPDQNLALLREPESLGSLGVRILVGHSRKSFLGPWFGFREAGAADPVARDQETALLSALLSARSVDYLRVHDVAASARALRAWSLAGPALDVGHIRNR
jgi:dihydropteroate synthase